MRGSSISDGTSLTAVAESGLNQSHDSWLLVRSVSDLGHALILEKVLQSAESIWVHRTFGVAHGCEQHLARRRTADKNRMGSVVVFVSDEAIIGVGAGQSASGIN